MQLKDYYKTLNILPQATHGQVKKSFRQLALQYHPDKNPGSAVAEARFREIQEAYEVLSNPQQREEYNYRRWYSKAIHQSFNAEMLDPRSIAAACKRLHDYCIRANIFRIDYESVSHHIRRLLSPTNIAILQQDETPHHRASVIDNLLQSAWMLPYPYVEPIADLLLQVANNDDRLTNSIQTALQQKRRQHHWEKIRLPVVLLVTILLCLFIYFLAR